MKCPYCNHSVTYKIKTGQEKCSFCKRKFSPGRILLHLQLIECFSRGFNANRTSKELGLNYVTVKKRFESFRILAAEHLENEYRNHQALEYDEYIYLPKSKKKIKENIFDSQNFLTFCYSGTKVYNLLMPSLKRYKQEFLDDGLENTYFKEFSKFMMFNKVAKTTKMENTITEFWNYFEKFILQYKGIDNENFIYYLKECEFNFNYSLKERISILKDLFFKNL